MGPSRHFSGEILRASIKRRRVAGHPSAFVVRSEFSSDDRAIAARAAVVDEQVVAIARQIDQTYLVFTNTTLFFVRDADTESLDYRDIHDVVVDPTREPWSRTRDKHQWT